ncbi:MAG: CHAD domain-containing protein [Sulfuricurvum sp.]|jgi:CHAD domain-containing protein
MDTTHDTSLNSLTVAQEFSQLISKIATKELDFFADDGIEVLHDLRVDLRKLRSWLQIINSAGYPVKKLYNHSIHCHSIGGELRNFDVLIHWINANSILLSPKLHHTLNLKRKKLKKAFLKELTHEKTLQELITLGRNFLPHIKGVSKSDLEPYVQQYIENKREHFNHLLSITSCDLKQLHEMRKILKKVRYSLQLLPSIDLKHQHALKELQNILGYINDRRVWIELIQSHIKKKSEETSALVDLFRADIEKKIDQFKDYITSEKVYF